MRDEDKGREREKERGGEKEKRGSEIPHERWKGVETEEREFQQQTQALTAEMSVNRALQTRVLVRSLTVEPAPYLAQEESRWVNGEVHVDVMVGPLLPPLGCVYGLVQSALGCSSEHRELDFRCL